MTSVLDVADLLEEVETPSRTIRAVAEPLRKPLVLIATPSRSTRNALSVALESAGYAVVETTDALTAAEQLRRSPDVGLLFVDRRLPGTEGLQFCRTIRLCHGPSLPIVLLSRETGWWLSHQARSAGAICVIRKPIVPDEILRIAAERLPVG